MISLKDKQIYSFLTAYINHIKLRQEIYSLLIASELLNDNQTEKTYIFDIKGTLLENFPIKSGISSYLGQSNPDSPIYLGLKNKLNQLRFYRVPK